jgi:putative ABC transport system permease protein
MNFLSEIREGLGISWDAVRANKMRSALATIGIVIGIVTVTLMGAAINGLNKAFVDSLSAMGGDTFFVTKTSWFDTYDEYLNDRKRKPIRPEDVESLARQTTLASAIDPEAEDYATVKYKTRNLDAVNIVGTTSENLITSGASVAQGRFLTPGDTKGGQPVCVLGSELATNLFRDESPLGKHIKIEDNSFLVVGVLQRRGNLFGSLDLDDRVIIPFRLFLAEIWSRPNMMIEVKANGLAQLPETKEELRQVMRHIRHLRPSDPDDFAINQQEQFVKLFHEQTAVIAGIGLFITSLALFVGGIGIMNIMFVSVVERTREIGVRKAIGAKRRTILLQFLAEAASICLGGGLIAIAIAWTVTAAVTKWMFPASLSPGIVIVAIIVSLLTGVVSGFLPAWRAARMDPVEALRSE